MLISLWYLFVIPIKASSIRNFYQISFNLIFSNLARFFSQFDRRVEPWICRLHAAFIAALGASGVIRSTRGFIEQTQCRVEDSTAPEKAKAAPGSRINIGGRVVSSERRPNRDTFI